MGARWGGPFPSYRQLRGRLDGAGGLAAASRPDCPSRFRLARSCAKLTPVVCPLCRQRKARRACPALRQDICAICCATKRLREIACPEDCSYLATARAHPPAVVQRQRERDTSFLVGLLNGLSDIQVALLSMAQERVRRYRPTAIPALTDHDVTEAAGAMASTLETASRGIVYEFQTPSLPAQRVLAEFRALQAEIEARRPAPARTVAAVFRKIEGASRSATEMVGGGETAFLDFIDRLAQGATERSGAPEPPAEAAAPDDTPRIILP